MKIIANKKRMKLVVVLAATVILFLICLRSTVVRESIYVLLISFMIAYSLRPIHKDLCNRGINKRVSAVMLIVLLVVFILLGFTVLIPSILKEGLKVNDEVSKIQVMVDRLNDQVKLLKNNKTMYVLLDNASGKVNNFLVKIFNRFLDGALNFGQNLLAASIIPIIAYYFLADGDNIGNKALILFPVKSRSMVKKVCRDIDKILGRYIASQLFLSVIIGFFTFGVLMYLRVDFPIILSILNAFFNIIPYFGPIFGALPAVLLAFIKGSKTGFYTLFSLYFIQLIEGNVISPKITGDSVSMHPLAVIILLLIGEKVGGFIGMVLAVPVGVVLKTVYEDIDYYMY